MEETETKLTYHVGERDGGYPATCGPKRSPTMTGPSRRQNASISEVATPRYLISFPKVAGRASTSTGEIGLTEVIDDEAEAPK